MEAHIKNAEMFLANKMQSEAISSLESANGILVDLDVNDKSVMIMSAFIVDMEGNVAISDGLFDVGEKKFKEFLDKARLVSKKIF